MNWQTEPVSRRRPAFQINHMEALPIPGPRIVVVGVTGSGKTTTSLRLARILDIPHIELDALHWQPNWVAMETEPFRQAVAQELAGPAWVIDGNYKKARDIIWERAATLVWLDYSLPVILWQLTLRTCKRVITREELWNGNYETLRGAFFSKDSLFLWALHTYPRFRREYLTYQTMPGGEHLQMIRLRSRRETARWLDHLEKHQFINENR